METEVCGGNDLDKPPGAGKDLVCSQPGKKAMEERRGKRQPGEGARGLAGHNGGFLFYIKAVRSHWKI